MRAATVGLVCGSCRDSDARPLLRTGYPDFIEDTEDPRKIYIMETNKKVCRLHLIAEATLEGLFAQHR